MTIADELRAYVHDCCAIIDDRIREIADRIDAEHDEQLARLYRDMSDAEYMRVPLDADGVPIHVGDYVEHVDDTLAPRAVTGINLTSDGWWVYINGVGRRPDKYRHRLPDTWERIIEDAIRGDGGSYGCLEERFDATVPALVARCKALAGDAE